MDSSTWRLRTTGDGAHDVVELGIDRHLGAYSICSCGWQSEWLPSPKDSSDAMASHWVEVSQLSSVESTPHA